MKAKTLLFLFLAFFTLGKIRAQSNQEAILTYQLAEEAYSKGEYDKAIEYLKKVETLNPDAKVKTSYLKAKCYGTSFVDNSQEKNINIFNDCINSIRYYIGFGKDEEKMTEVLKIKITLENSNLAKLNKKFENMSTTDAFNIIYEIMKQYQYDQSNNEFPWYQVWLDKGTFYVKKRVWKGYIGTYIGEVGVISIDLSDAYFMVNEQGYDIFALGTNNKNSFHNVYETYIKPRVYDKYNIEDADNYIKGNNKTHGGHGHFTESNLEFLHLDYIIKIDALNQSTKDDLKMAFRVLIKNCGGGKK